MDEVRCDPKFNESAGAKIFQMSHQVPVLQNPQSRKVVKNQYKTLRHELAESTVDAIIPWMNKHDASVVAHCRSEAEKRTVYWIIHSVAYARPIVCFWKQILSKFQLSFGQGKQVEEPVENGNLVGQDRSH